jgi:hypothetical protein
MRSHIQYEFFKTAHYTCLKHIFCPKVDRIDEILYYIYSDIGGRLAR